MTERTKGEGPVAEVHRRLDALEQRMATVERDRYRVPQCEGPPNDQSEAPPSWAIIAGDEIGIASEEVWTWHPDKPLPCIFGTRAEAVADARPADDPEMRERVGQALSVEEEPWAFLTIELDSEDDEFPWRVNLHFAGDWLNVFEAETSEEAEILRDKLVDELTNAHTAPLRAECERLTGILHNEQRRAIRRELEEDALRERAAKAEAALADCQRERDEARARHESEVQACARQYEKDIHSLSRTIGRIESALGACGPADDGSRAVQAAKRLTNARRSTIEELASDAEQSAQDEAYVSWFGVRDWLRSQLDTEPTEQPTVCPRCDGNDNEPGSMADCDLCGGATEQPAPAAPSVEGDPESAEEVTP